ncbi:hypothetical protein BaRGS_00007517 [Batillaria attramentaria]|uniref:Uncharacterized protein n=1 Tax=Batillaria attramentaria TaxID=370345 RepID=A0ABD0LPA5_9CAEN
MFSALFSANSLRQDTDRHGNGVVVQLPVDKRLLWLRQGGGLLPHSGWSSFNSDASNLTSGSSANSVDWLLQERQVDPEVVLRNLGFGGGHIQSTSGMYNRIPVRFFPQEAAPPDEAEGGAQEGGAEGGRRNPSRGQLIPNFATSCLDNEYYTEMLNRVPAYFFRESEASEVHSDSEDSDILPLDSLTHSRTPCVSWTVTKANSPEGEGGTEDCINTSDLPRTSQDSEGQKTDDDVVSGSSQGHPHDSPGRKMLWERHHMDYLLPDDDNLSSSSGSTTTADDVKFNYNVRLSPNESLV